MSDHACLLEQECQRCEGTGRIDDEDVSPVTDLPGFRCEECDGTGQGALIPEFHGAFAAATGIYFNISEPDTDSAPARLAAARFLRARRAEGRHVAKLAPKDGETHRWEVSERPNAVIIDDRSGILTIDETDSDEHETCEHCRDGYLPEHCGMCDQELTESSYFGTPRGNDATYRAESCEITCADCAPTRIDCPDCAGEGTRSVLASEATLTDPATDQETTRRIRRNRCSCCGYSWDYAASRYKDECPTHIVVEARIVDVDGIYMPLLCAEWSLAPDGTVTASGGCWEGAERASPDHPRAERLAALREILPGEEDDAIASDMSDDMRDGENA